MDGKILRLLPPACSPTITLYTAARVILKCKMSNLQELSITPQPVSSTITTCSVFLSFSSPNKCFSTSGPLHVSFLCLQCSSQLHLAPSPPSNAWPKCYSSGVFSDYSSQGRPLFPLLVSFVELHSNCALLFIPSLPCASHQA